MCALAPAYIPAAEAAADDNDDWLAGDEPPAVVIEHQRHTLPAALEEALKRHLSGQLAEASEIYQQILALEPAHDEALHLLGMVAGQQGAAERALSLIAQAVRLNPDNAAYRNNLANTLRQLGRLDEALVQYRDALALRPDAPEIHNNYANALRDRGRLRDAMASYLMALELAPHSAEIHYNLANVYADQGDSADAEHHYRRALALRPAFADALYNLGRVLIQQNLLDEAERNYRAALSLRPDHAAAWNNLGTVLQEQGRLAEAEACYTTALRLDSACIDAHYNLGCAFLAQNYQDSAALCFRLVLSLAPDDGRARLALCLAELPIVYADEAEVTRRRASYRQALERLAADLQQPQPQSLVHLAEGVGTLQPFFLPYQGENDRELQELYGALVCRAMAAARPAPRLPARPAPGERIRLGIVSGHFSDHTIWRLFLKSWVTRLDRSRFEVFCYHTGAKHDGETEIARAFADRFLEGRRTDQAWRQAILSDRIQVLLYPEIGMDPMSLRLAAQRLARVQAVAWGQPETTGLPTMDLFLSSELMEPADGERHYSERLVRLPHLGTCYEPELTTPWPSCRADFGLREQAVVYWCGQALYKYHPRDDALLPRIAHAVGDCQFVLIEHTPGTAVTDLVRQRLERAFTAAGLAPERHLVFLKPMPQAGFLATVGLSDVLLDSIGWSGGRSTLDCLSRDRPIVTLPGALMRSRHTAAILTRMGLTETIAHSVDEYVALAVRLGQEPAWRIDLGRRIATAKAAVFGDHTCLAALEEVLVQALAGPAEIALAGPSGRSAMTNAVSA